MASPLQFMPLIARQTFAKQSLERIPEKTVTDDPDNVVQYDRVMETKLAINYAIAIETIYRTRGEPFGGSVLDICCGPGHMAINMVKELKLDSLTGVDLSEGMVAAATDNAKQQGLANVRFAQGDATKLVDYDDGAFDLTTMMDAAHHMSVENEPSSLEIVNRALLEMDRVTHPDGLVVVMDLVRLRTKSLTEAYVKLLAADYAARGLPNFYDDFRNSMYAAWTPAELSSAVPADSKRNWSLVVPRGLPFAQFLIGRPASRKELFVRSGRLWDKKTLPVPTADRSEYRIAKLTMANAAIQTIKS